MRHLTLVLAVGLLAGCASTSTPNYDARFGDAVRQARQAMTLNSIPAPSAQPVGTLDGRIAREASERYLDTYKAPPVPINVINIGGALGEGGGR